MGTEVAMGGGGKGSRDWAALGASRSVRPPGPEADRTELHRLDLLQEPLRRLSECTATSKARCSDLEHKLEQLQADASHVNSLESSIKVLQKQMEIVEQRFEELQERPARST